MAKRANIKTLADYRAAVEAEITAAMSEIDIREHVRSLLQSKAYQIVTAALGFDTRWDRIEVDHCNGLRNKAADTMLAEAKDAAELWLLEQAGALPKLSAAAVKALHRDYLTCLNTETRRLLQERATRDAARQVDAILQDDA